MYVHALLYLLIDVTSKQKIKNKLDVYIVKTIHF